MDQLAPLASRLNALDQPRDRWLAERMVDRLALTRATNETDLDVDHNLVMKGFDFDTVWSERRTFVADDVQREGAT